MSSRCLTPVVTTVAKVVRSSYDSGGGDPNGWTTDRVVFADRHGQTVSATVGHHGVNSSERSTGRLMVIYDPLHPTQVMSELDYQYDSSAGGVLISAAIFALITLAAGGVLLSALQLTVTRRSSSGRLRRP